MIWLTGGLVYDVHGGSFQRGDLAVDGGRIVELATPGRGPAGSNDQEVALTGAYLLPGLIDCHVHLTIRSEDADPAAAAGRSNGEIAAHAARAAERTLLGGVTTVRDLGGWNYLEMGVRRAIEEGRLPGPRMFLAGRLLSVPTPATSYYPGMYHVVSGTDGVRAGVRAQLEQGADLIKVMATGAMLSPENEDASAAQFSIEELRAAVRAAAEGGAHVAAHAHAREGIENAVEAGVASIEHGTFADEEILSRVAAAGIFMVPTNSAFSGTSMDPAIFDELPIHLQRRFRDHEETHREAMRAAHRLGVPIAMGTDAGTPGNHHGSNAFECLLMVNEMGLSPEESILASTDGPARLLGRQGDLGSIREGAFADLVGTRGNPLEDIGELTRVPLVMKDGTVARYDR